jgi:hypothetical protein
MAVKKAQKKVAKKTAVKSYSGDEVKRYLGSLSEDFQRHLDGHAKQSERNIGALSEDFQHKVSAIAEQFGSIHADTKETRALVGAQERLLNLHTLMLSGQAETLKAHTEMIGQLMEDVNVMKGDIQEIKTDFKQKVDRTEFARLEKRVLAIESREYFGKSRK